MKPSAPVQRQPRRPERRVFRRQRRPPAWRQALVGVACIAGGVGLIVALQLLVHKLDAVLLLSEALSHLISGLTHLAAGIGQLAGVLLLLVAAIAGLLLLLAGLIRLGRALLPAGGGSATPPAGGRAKGRQGPGGRDGTGSRRRRP